MIGKKTLIIGGGAIGRSLACWIPKRRTPTVLTQAEIRIPHQLINVDRPESGQFSFEVIRTLPADPSEFDNVIIATKAHKLSVLFEPLKQWSQGKHSIIFIQNGLGIYEESNSNFSTQPLFRGALYYGAEVLSPEKTKIVGIPKIQLAPQNHSTGAAVALFKESGFEVSTLSDPIEVEWRKALVLLSLVLVSAIRRETNDIVLRDSAAQTECRSLLHEVRMLSKAEGYSLDSIADDSIFESVKNYGKNRNSLLIDMEQGRATELPWTIGKALSIAKTRNIETPYLSHMAQKFEQLIPIS